MVIDFRAPGGQRHRGFLLSLNVDGSNRRPHEQQSGDDGEAIVRVYFMEPPQDPSSFAKTQ